MSKVLILKVVREDMTSHNGFKWPESGEVKPTHWDPESGCGNGLHGWLAGEGSYIHTFMDGKWIVFEADAKDVVSLDGGEKIKARCGNVVYCGDRPGAIAYLKEHSAITEKSNPGLCCFTPTQQTELAFRWANRAVKLHAVKALRAAKLEKEAEKLEALPMIDSPSASYAASYAASRAASYAASRAASYASYASYAASYAASRAASYASDAASDAASYAASDASGAASYAASYAASDAASRAEKEEQRLDKLTLLGFNVRQ